MTAEELAKLGTAFVKCGLDTKKLEAQLFALEMPVARSDSSIAEIVDAADEKYQAVVLLRQVKGHLAKAAGLLALVHPD